MSAKRQGHRTFIDVDGNRYDTPEEPLAEGGQGRVYLSHDREIAIKIALDDKKSYEEYEKSLDKTSGIFIHPKAGLARPIVKLAKPDKGYVMRFLDGGKPVGSLMKCEKAEEPLKEYHAGGGLKRRLLLLKDLAKTLYYIHGAGAVYGDISEKNVFISKMPDIKSMASGDAKIWLIDADNISTGRLAGPLYTPGFGAPEVVKCAGFKDGGRPNTAASDIYSFALLAYRLLNINDPFDGVSSEEAGWDAEPSAAADEPAEEGGKAFIYDSEDDSNRPGDGILPWRFGITKKMLGLFERAFSCNSRKRFEGRPSAAEWHAALCEAAGRVCYCEECGAHHYYDVAELLHKGRRHSGWLAKTDILTPTGDGYGVVSTHIAVLYGKTDILDYKMVLSSLDEAAALVAEAADKEVKVSTPNGYKHDVFDGAGARKLEQEQSAVMPGDTVWITNTKAPDEFTARVVFRRAE
ncbi:MAG: hypothetical protein LBB74_10850 [Chitinispirillales bacterium]|nr:hypothetical protein [Chitinispirillales bacterium]